LRIGGQPAVGGAGDVKTNRRRVGELVLELPRDPDATRGGGLTVEHHQVDLVVVDQSHAFVVGGGVDEFDGHVRARVGADGQPHPLADDGIVAVKQHCVLGHAVDPSCAFCSASRRSSWRSMRAALRRDCCTHWATSTASIATETSSPPAHRMPPAVTWSATGSAHVKPSDGYQSPPSRFFCCITVRPSTV